jgi:3',5'-cyclic AMP phosphodiesterase CpdA
MLTALLFAAATATFPTIQQVPTGAPALPANPTATQFTFVVAGDNRPAKSTDPLTTPLTAIIATLAKSPPAFVIWNGDAVYGKTHKGITAEYTQFLTAFAALKSAPLFNAPGNHEMVNDITCGKKETGEYPDTSGKLLADYTSSMSLPYGVFRYGNAAFVIVNTDDMLDVKLSDHCQYNGYVSKAQLASLTATLSQLDGDSSVTHIFLFMHRPIHDDGGHQIGNGKTDTSAYGTQVEAFRHDIDHGGYKKLLFVFSSHDHRYYLYPTTASLSGTSPGAGGEPTFLVTGGAGAPLAGCKKGGTGSPGAYYHYLKVSVDGANVAITVVPLYGTTPCTQPN